MQLYQNSIFISSVCFAMFITIVSGIGIISIFDEHLSLSFLYAIFSSIALTFNITEIIHDPWAILLNKENFFKCLFLIILNIDIWLYAKMLYIKQCLFLKEQYIINDLTIYSQHI